MKLILLVLSVVSLSSAYANPINTDFNAYIAEYKKTYDPSELQMRKSIFESNVNKINEYNRWAEANGFDSRLGVTDFTDLDYSEFVRKHTGYAPLGGGSTHGLRVADQAFLPKATALAASWDWRSQGKVNPIKDQGKCGSCWAFSITAIGEISHAIKNNLNLNSNNLVTLAEQELVDCVGANSHCAGGDPVNAALYLLANGSELNSAYPYVAKNQTCGFNPSKVVAKPKYGWLWQGTEANLKAIVSQTGPVAVVIKATQTIQQFKSTGILADPLCANTRYTDVNHAVTIVGYGTLNGQEYWLVRNQWGTNWGDAGYIRIPLGKNYCGIMYEPIYFTYQ